MTQLEGWAFVEAVASLKLGEKLGLREADLQSYGPMAEGFAELPSFEDEAIPVIQEGLDRGESPLRIKRAPRMIQAYEKMFWDTMAASAELG